MINEVRLQNFTGTKHELIVKEFISSAQKEKVLILDVTLKAKLEMSPKQYLSIEVMLAHPASLTIKG